MAKKIVDKIAEATSRRGFFARAAAFCLGGTAALLGLAKPAQALRSVRCCNLCTSDCTGSCPGSWWSWTCCHFGKLWSCMECFNPGYTPHCGCYGINCSLALYEGFNCSPFTPSCGG